MNGKTIWGIVFLVFGVILGLNALNITSINIFFDGWWTLFIIIPSFVGVLKRENVGFNLILFLIGMYLLLACNDIIDFRGIVSKLLLPLIFVIFGLSLMFKKNKNHVTYVEEDDEDDDDEDDEDEEDLDKISVLFKEDNVKVKNLNNLKLEATFGTLNIDASSVKVKEDITIKTSVVFGTLKIKVPKDVSVKLISNGIFKDDINNVKVKSKNTIFIKADTCFGSVIINND